MAEVSLTLVDPEAYEGPLLGEPEVVVENGDADWDEQKVREQNAAEVEEIIAETQPGVVIGEREVARLGARALSRVLLLKARPKSRRLRLQQRHRMGRKFPRWC